MRNMTRRFSWADSHMSFNCFRLRFVDGHGVAQLEAAFGFFKCDDHGNVLVIQQMKRLVFEGDNFIPNTVQDAVIYAASHQFKAWVQKYGAVAAFQQLRVLGSKTTIGFLVDLLAPGIISAQGYARLAFAVNLGTRLSHTVLERLTTAKHVEFVQERTAALTDIQFNADGGQAPEKVLSLIHI